MPCSYNLHDADTCPWEVCETLGGVYAFDFSLGVHVCCAAGCTSCAANTYAQATSLTSISNPFPCALTDTRCCAPAIALKPTFCSENNPPPCVLDGNLGITQVKSSDPREVCLSSPDWLDDSATSCPATCAAQTAAPSSIMTAWKPMTARVCRWTLNQPYGVVLIIHTLL